MAGRLLAEPSLLYTGSASAGAAGAVAGGRGEQLVVVPPQLLEPLDRCARAFDALAQQQECHRSDHDRASWNPKTASLFQFGEHLVGVQGELGPWLDLGNDVVVV